MLRIQEDFVCPGFPGQDNSRGETETKGEGREKMNEAFAIR